MALFEFTGLTTEPDYILTYILVCSYESQNNNSKTVRIKQLLFSWTCRAQQWTTYESTTIIINAYRRNAICFFFIWPAVRVNICYFGIYERNRRYCVDSKSERPNSVTSEMRMIGEQSLREMAHVILRQWSPYWAVNTLTPEKWREIHTFLPIDIRRLSCLRLLGVEK